MEETKTDMGQALDWEGEVSDEGGAYEVVPAGTYPAIVEKVERERFEGSAKIAACPRAAVHLRVFLPDGGDSVVVDRILLSTKTAWRVARFFEGLGFAKDPETGKVPMRWNEVDGKQCLVALKVRQYQKKDGSTGESNDVEKYLPPSQWPDSMRGGGAQAAPAPAQQWGM